MFAAVAIFSGVGDDDLDGQACGRQAGRCPPGVSINDRLYGEAGNDNVVGGDGRDTL